MHTGRYAEALEAFRSIAKEHQEKEALTPEIADALIKMAVLTLIVKDFGIGTQQRQRRLAAAALGDYEQGGVTDVEMLARTNAAIHQDALYNVAWFNRARCLKRSGKESDALLSYLAAAAVRTTDDESWLNAILLAGRHNQNLLLSLLVHVPSIRGEEFVRYMAETAQRQTNEIGRQLLSNMAQLFSENLPKRDDAVIRVHSRKGKLPLIISTSSDAIKVHRAERKRKEKRIRKLKEKQKRRNRAKGGRKK